MEIEIEKRIKTTLKCEKCGRSLSILEYLEVEKDENSKTVNRQVFFPYIECPCGSKRMKHSEIKNFLRENYKENGAEVESIIEEIDEFQNEI